MSAVAVLNDISWTFHNYGPLTATFTPAPSCSGPSHIQFGSVEEDNFVHLTYNAQCETTTWPDCAPPSTITPSPTGFPSADDDQWYSSVGNYYSPGLYCPSGWETVGVAGRDGDKAYTTSGAMSYGASTWAPSFPFEPTMLAEILKPSETVALCCPSGFTADPLGNCFTTVPSYTPTSMCDVYDDYYSSRIKSTSVYTTGGTKTETVITSTTTVHSMSTYAMDISPDELEVFSEHFTPLYYVSAVTLIHHASDVSATGEAGTATFTGSSTGAPTGTGQTTGHTGMASSTSNAGMRLAPRGSRWTGFGAVLGVSLAAAALGVSIILPF